jgi:ribonucleotide reductase beta subunit family protein with ferritin-like domain
MKWITSNKSFAARLVAFIIVEGLFFSGAFCCIFWLAEKNIMNGLCKANEFIARDEAIHTEFGIYLYVNYIKNKLTNDVFSTIMKEAVDIEIEFITESLPCKLIGMNSASMITYIKYVCNRITAQLGYPILYQNVNQPFDFMDRISLSNKSNFFEDESANYAKPVSENNAVDPYAEL